jgi:hypothetical protein
LGYDVDFEPEELPDEPPFDLYPETELQLALTQFILTDLEKFLGTAGEFVVYRQ